jgi:hypothetical protein
VSCLFWAFGFSLSRTLEAFRDLGISIAYFFCWSFGIPFDKDPTVLLIPASPWKLLPYTWPEFTERMSAAWNLLISPDNLISYIGSTRALSGILMNVIVMLLPVIIGLYYVISSNLEKHNNNYNLDSRPLQIYKKLTRFYKPLNQWIREFIDFFKQSPYSRILLFVWLLNLNLITIFVGFFAYYLYFAASYNFISLYTQIVRLVIDLQVIIRFIPLSIWFVIGFYFYDKIRKGIAYRTLSFFENGNRSLIQSLSLVIMIVGTMGKKKTTLLTDMVLSEEVIMRDKALELIQDNDLKFPYFPWINFENVLKDLIRSHSIYNLASARQYVRNVKRMRFLIDNSDIARRSWLKHCRRLEKKGKGYKYPDFCFGYDFHRYGIHFDDKLKVSNFYDVLESYAQLYLIYLIQSALIIGNYSVRVDNQLIDGGNFPLWNNDFFRKSSKDIDSISRYSHILDFDTLRLGRKLIENNQGNRSFEFGVIAITEIGKERGNQNDLIGLKKRSDDTNQKNDLFNHSLKLCRHPATIDNYPFIKIITDDQRPESLGADARDLCHIVHIDDCSDLRLSMPGFFLEELIYGFAFRPFINLYTQYRFNRADNTLFMYLLKGLVSKLHAYYNGIYNRFSFFKLNLKVEQGTLKRDKDDDSARFEDKRYFIMPKKIYSKRFSTDCFSDLFLEKALSSNVGIEDLPEYKSVKASFEELEAQNSYFISELMDIRRIDSKDS